MLAWLIEDQPHDRSIAVREFTSLWGTNARLLLSKGAQWPPSFHGARLSADCRSPDVVVLDVFHGATYTARRFYEAFREWEGGSANAWLIVWGNYRWLESAGLFFDQQLTRDPRLILCPVKSADLLRQALRKARLDPWSASSA